MKKKTIGQIELVLGIILLVCVVVGYASLSNKYQKSSSERLNDLFTYSPATADGWSNFSNEAKTTILYDYFSAVTTERASLSNFYIMGTSTMLILIFLAIMMIIEGGYKILR